MGSYGDHYVVGAEYRNSRDLETNEFLRWLNGPLDGGVNFGRGIAQLKQPGTDECEFLVFYSSDGGSQSPDPWEDIINLEDGIVHYWGDSKAGDGPDPSQRDGNQLVKQQYCETYAKNNREDAPPVLLFVKEESGWVTFNGLCIISGLEIGRHNHDGETVVNYRISLDILDADAVDLEWIHRKARTGVDIGGPEAWDHWVETGTVNRYSIYNDQIRSGSAQQPTGRFKELHSNIRAHFEGNTREQGKKLEHLIKRILENLDHVDDVQLTPDSGDRGVDLTGKIDLLADTPVPGPDTKIQFKAQVKNKASSVGGRELSRLASRIDDGEIGLFFTMSHYTKSAQEENLSTYPVRLFAGKDLISLLVQTDLVDDTDLNPRVVDEINEAV